MMPRNNPIEDQNERLMDIEVGDSIIWRGRHADHRDKFIFDPFFEDPRRFQFEKQDDGVYLVTRLSDEY